MKSGNNTNELIKMEAMEKKMLAVNNNCQLGVVSDDSNVDQLIIRATLLSNQSFLSLYFSFHIHFIASIINLKAFSPLLIYFLLLSPLRLLSLNDECQFCIVNDECQTGET